MNNYSFWHGNVAHWLRGWTFQLANPDLSLGVTMLASGRASNQICYKAENMLELT